MEKQSPRWLIGSLVVDTLTAAFPYFPVVRNPRHASHLDVGPQVLLVKELDDALVGRSGNTEKRILTATIGVLSRNENADADADLLHQQVGVALRALMLDRAPKLRALGVSEMEEAQVQFSVEGLDVDGALIVGSWKFTYTRQRDRDLRR
jgi:hypothetical protein